MVTKITLHKTFLECMSLVDTVPRVQSPSGPVKVWGASIASCILSRAENGTFVSLHARIDIWMMSRFGKSVFIFLHEVGHNYLLPFCDMYLYHISEG